MQCGVGEIMVCWNSKATILRSWCPGFEASGGVLRSILADSECQVLNVKDQG